MIGEIVIKNKNCKACPFAELDIKTLYCDNIPVMSTISCKHEDSCRRIEFLKDKKEDE